MQLGKVTLKVSEEVIILRKRTNEKVMELTNNAV